MRSEQSLSLDSLLWWGGEKSSVDAGVKRLAPPLKAARSSRISIAKPAKPATPAAKTRRWGLGKSAEAGERKQKSRAKSKAKSKPPVQQRMTLKATKQQQQKQKQKQQKKTIKLREQKQQRPARTAAKADAKIDAKPSNARLSNAKPWRPSRAQAAARRHMIRELVWLDGHGLAKRFATAVPRAMMPWEAGVTAGEELDQSMRDLQRHQSLLQWHVNKNVLPADINTLLSPTLDAYTNTLLPEVEKLTIPPSSRRSTSSIPAGWGKGNGDDQASDGKEAAAAPPAEDALAWAKAPELKDALLEVSPALFSLVRAAAAKEPASSVRLWRRVAVALTTLVWWNAGRLVRAGPQRQYPLMNAFLEQILVTVTDCQSVLGCGGDDACVISAVEAQQAYLQRQIKRVGPELNSRRAQVTSNNNSRKKKPPAKPAAKKAERAKKARAKKARAKSKPRKGLFVFR